MSARRPTDPSPELNGYQTLRQHLVQEHEQLLSRIRSRPPAAAGRDGDHPLLARFKELQCLVDVQRLQIGDLQEIEKSYHKLLNQFDIIEQTNQQLVQQLLLFSDLDDRKKELEALVRKQQVELLSARTHLREARSRIDALRTRLMQLEDDNAHLANRMEDYRIRLEDLLEKDERNGKQVEQLKVELKRSRETYESLHRKYRKIQGEYESMYKEK